MKMINLYKNKTKLLLIELLLEQYGTQKQKELYENIIEFEKNSIINIIKNEILLEKKDICYNSYYNKLKELMIKASEIIFKINEVLIFYTFIVKLYNKNK